MNFKLVEKIAFVILCSLVPQISSGQRESNCLKAHPRVLHALFNYYNKDIDPWEVTENEVRSMTHLFSFRFDRAFIENGIVASGLLPVATSVAKYRADSRSGVQLYLINHSDPSEVSKNDTILMLKGYLEMIRTVHRVDNGTIGGLILRTNLQTFAEDLEAYEGAFGPLESFTEFNLGIMIEQQFMLKSAEPNQLFPKLKFLILTLEVKDLESPELSADEIISSCDYFQAITRLKNISAEILCLTAYPSKGTTKNKVQGSLDGFTRFWCRIVERLAREKDHAPIIMQSAFDESSTALDDNAEFLPRIYNGWWRRNNLFSSRESDFDEKVELLNNVSSSKRPGDSKCHPSGSNYAAGALVVVITQFLLITFLVLMSIKNLFNVGHAKLISDSDDIPTFELARPECTALNDEEFLLPSGISLRIPQYPAPN